MYGDDVRHSNESGNDVDDTVTQSGIANTNASRIGRDCDFEMESGSGNGAVNENETDFRVGFYPDLPNFKIPSKCVMNEND